MNPFSPSFKSNNNLTATGTAASIPIIADDDQVRIVNSGNNVAYVQTYDSKGTVEAADDSDYAVFPAQSSVITKPQSHNALSYFSPLGTTISVMTGKGI